LRKEEAMMKALLRGRLLLITLVCLTCLGTTGCGGLTNIQLTSILQASLQSGLSALAQAIVAIATGTALQGGV
jgi:hypothetical protein